MNATLVKIGPLGERRGERALHVFIVKLHHRLLVLPRVGVVVQAVPPLVATLEVLVHHPGEVGFRLELRVGGLDLFPKRAPRAVRRRVFLAELVPLPIPLLLHGVGAVVARKPVLVMVPLALVALVALLVRAGGHQVGLPCGEHVIEARALHARCQSLALVNYQTPIQATVMQTTTHAQTINGPRCNTIIIIAASSSPALRRPRTPASSETRTERSWFRRWREYAGRRSRPRCTSNRVKGCMRRWSPNPLATCVRLGLPPDLRQTHAAVLLGLSAQQKAALSVASLRPQRSCRATHSATVKESRGRLKARVCACVRDRGGTASV